jgi:hypothetical protein
MNKYKISLFSCLAAAVFLLASCGKSYLQTDPTDRVPTNQALATTTGCWDLLNGVHRILYSAQLGRQDMVGQGTNMMYMDLMGEDMPIYSLDDWFVAPYLWYQSNRSATSATVYFNYFFYYEIINNVNLLIDSTNKSKGPDADKRAILGQAYAYRAWSYFQLVQLYGQRYDATDNNTTSGVPLMLHSQQGSTARSTVNLVYQRINTDIDSAILLLDGYARANKSHLDKSVAQGIKARVALTQQDWTTAATMAAAALNSYPLMDSTAYMSGFNNYTNPEWIWGSHQQDNQTTYFASFFAYMSCNFPSLNVRESPRTILDSIYRLIPNTDVRWQLWDSTGTNKNFPVPVDGSGADAGTRLKFMQRKFKVANPQLSVGDVPLMRASEMYLVEAEAYSHLGQDAKAAAALYPLAKSRDASYNLSTKTGAALLSEILFQRRIELWGEGFRFYDLKRLNLPLYRGRHTFMKSYQQNIPAGDVKWQFLIPQSEIDATGGVVIQNPIN